MSFLILGLSMLLFGQQTPAAGQSHYPPPKLIGPVQRDVSDKSPVAEAIISRVTNRPDLHVKLLVTIDVHNLTSHELVYVGTSADFELRHKGSGLLVQETPIGCADHFFSECHTTQLYPGRITPMTTRVPAKGMTNIGLYWEDYDYVLTPGEYTLQGYFCAPNQHEGPECLKTNIITVTIR